MSSAKARDAHRVCLELRGACAPVFECGEGAGTIVAEYNDGVGEVYEALDCCEGESAGVAFGVDLASGDGVARESA